MTQKDEVNNVTTAPATASPANLPPLSEMIMTSIEMLNDKAGSDKTTIQKHIESNYSSLSPDFSVSLSTHLEEMKQNGQIVMVNDKYKKPESDAPPQRRGRGRPPKPKPALPTGYIVPPARPRGRPPKARDPLAPPLPPKAAATSSGRKRGRPPKANKAPKPEGVAPSGERRGRGRPPKVRPPVVVPVGF